MGERTWNAERLLVDAGISVVKVGSVQTSQAAAPEISNLHWKQSANHMSRGGGSGGNKAAFEWHLQAKAPGPAHQAHGISH